MTADLTFSDILTAVARGWRARKADESVFSLAIPIKLVDPLAKLPLLARETQFSFLWDRTPGFSFAAAGKCQTLDLVGPRRFELAQKFSDATLGSVIDATKEGPAQALPRILLAFSFFNHTKVKYM